MAILISPLEAPLETLRDHLAASSSPASSKDASRGADETLAALKKVKHVLIGSTNRKVELAQQPESLRLIVSLLDVSGYDNVLVSHKCEALAIVAAMSIPREECLSALFSQNVLEKLLSLVEQAQKDLTLLSDWNDPSETSNIYASTSSTIPATTLLNELVAGTRALKSFYEAILNLVDPLASDTFTYDMIVKNSLDKLEKMGTKLVIPDLGKANTLSLEKLGGINGKAAAGRTFLNEANDLADTALLGRDSEILLKMLFHLGHFVLPSIIADKTKIPSGVNTAPVRASVYQIIKHVSDIFRVCTRSEQQQKALYRFAKQTHEDGWIHPDPLYLLCELLQEAPTQVTESIIGAIASLLKDEPAIPKLGIHILGQGADGRLPSISEKVTDKSPSMRLVAAECEVNFCKNIRRVGSARIQVQEFGGAPLTAVLLQLLSNESPSISARAAFVFAYFVSGDPSLQETASNMDAFLRLQALLERLSQPVEPYATVNAEKERSRQQQAALLAISALCTDKEELRRKVMDGQLLPFIIDSLNSPFSNVRCAAAQCTRSLSRSINILKTALVDTNAAPSLSKLLNPSEAPETRLAAIAIMGNVFLEYSPLKRPLLEIEGLVEKIAALTKLDKDALLTKGTKEKDIMLALLLRHHALTALKSMSYWAVSEVKEKTTKCLTWEHIVSLLRSSDIAIKSVAYGLLRNLACSDVKDIDLVVRGIGEARLFALIEDALQNGPPVLLDHALYLVVNIATGTDAHRSGIMNRLGILRAIQSHLNHAAPDIRIAAVWAIINLCYKSQPGHQRFNENAQRLKSLGVEQRLKEMRDDKSLEVRERVRDALENSFEPLDVLNSHSMLVE